jgi:hypothetical protein
MRNFAMKRLDQPSAESIAHFLDVVRRMNPGVDIGGDEENKIVARWLEDRAARAADRILAIRS